MKSTEEKSNKKWIKKQRTNTHSSQFKTTRDREREWKKCIRQNGEKTKEKTSQRNNIGLPYWRDRVITSSDPYLKDLSAPLNIFQLAIRPTPKALFNMLTYIYTCGVLYEERIYWDAHTHQPILSSLFLPLLDCGPNVPIYCMCWACYSTPHTQLNTAITQIPNEKYKMLTNNR